MRASERAGERPGQRPRGERSYLSLIPRRNFQRALFLLLALLAVVALKKSGGGFFGSVLNGVAPPATAPARPSAPPTTVHIQLQAPPP
jgi:hypothetical protein